MRGFHSHYLLNDRDFVREAKTEARFELYSLGACPAMVEGSATAILTPRRSAGSIGSKGTRAFYEQKQILLSGWDWAWAYLHKDDQVRGRSMVKGGRW